MKLNPQFFRETFEKNLSLFIASKSIFFSLNVYRCTRNSKDAQNNKEAVTTTFLYNLCRTRQVWDVWTLQKRVSTNILDLNHEQCKSQWLKKVLHNLHFKNKIFDLPRQCVVLTPRV
jgi:hypothetical protein